MKIMSDLDEIRRQIRSAFPSETFFGAVTNGCKCDECAELVRNLRYQKWDDLNNETMDAQFGSLPLLSPEAFSMFIPAWLMRSLDNLEAEEQQFCEWTLYAFALYHHEEDSADDLSHKIDRMRSRAERLTREQIHAVAAFLRLIQHRTSLSEWDRESIRRALELVWGR